MKREKRKRRWYRYVIQFIVMALIVSSIPMEAIAETMNKDKSAQENKVPSTEQAKKKAEQKRTSDGKPTEVVEERTEHEKVFDNKNGTYTKKVYTEPIHTKKDGKLEEIQPELVEKSPQTIATKTTKLKPTFQKKLEKKEYAAFEVDGHKVTYKLTGAKGEKEGLQPSQVAATYEKNEIWYKNIFPKIDLRTITFNDKVKEDIVLNEYTGHHIFTFQLQTTLTPKLEEDGSILMVDDKQKIVFTLPKPFMTDSNIHPESNEAPISEDVKYTLEKQENNTYNVTVTADPKWLQAPERKYPVYIDPSITMGSFQEAYVSSAHPKNNYSRWVLWDEGQKAHTLKVGYFDNRTGYNFAYMKPELSSLNGAIVHDAQFYAYASWHYYGNNPNEVWLDEVKGDWDYITMNWETKPWSEEIAVTNVGRHQWAQFNVTNTVKAWVSGERPNYGFKLHPNGRGQTHWKKFIAAYNGGDTAPHLEITYSYPKPNKPRLSAYSNGIGSETGHINVNWDAVPGATGYRVGIFDGEDYNYYQVGNTTSWSTKDKKIWPNKEEVSRGRNELHFDGLGGEVPTSPSQLYQNNGSKEQGNDKHAYKVKVVAEYPHDEMSPESDEEKVFVPLEAPKQPKSHAFTNLTGSQSGYIELNWDQIPGATGYRVIFYNGKSHDVFDVGNVTKWSTQGKKIYPTADELKNGRYQFHTDGKGEELALNPSKLYENAGDFRSDKYWVHIQAYSNIGHAESTYSPDYGIKMTEPTDIFGLKDYMASVDVIGGKVNATNGNFVMDESDFTLSGRGPDLRIDRVYNSNSTEQGVLGKGWTSSFDEKVQEQPNGDVHFIHEDRAVDRFEKTGDNSYKAPPGVFFEIKKTDSRYTVTDKDQTVSEYDKQGRLTKVKDEHGNTLTYRYENGRVVEITNASNRKVSLQYTDGLLTKLVGPENRTVTYTYKDGQLVGVTTPRGKQYRYGYENGKLRYAYDPKHTEQKPYKTTYTYDNNRLVSVKDALGKETKLSYNSEAREVTVIDPKNVKDMYHYNLAGNPAKTVVDAAGLKLTTTYEYETNNLTKKTDPKDQGKRVSESYTYDGKGNVTSATDAIGTEKYEYNQNNDVTKVTDTENKTASVTYNGANAVSETDYKAQTSSVTQYDSYGNPIRGSLELAPGGNLMRNPGFEAGGDHWELRGWNDGGKNEIDRNVRAPQLGQTSSLRMDTKGINDSWGATIASQKVDVEPNKPYILSGWIKTSGLEKAGAHFYVIQLDEHGNHVGTISNNHSKVSGTTDWTKRQVPIVTSDKTRQLIIEVFTAHESAEGKGTAWFDNFQLEEGPISSSFNPVPNPSFEYYKEKLDNWHTWLNLPRDNIGEGFGGHSALVMERKSQDDPSPDLHYRQEIALNQSQAKDITVTAMSKAENVKHSSTSQPNNGYSVWIYAEHEGGTWKSYYITFPLGTKDWNRGAVVIPASAGAIKRIQLHTMLDKELTGKVWFDDIRIMEGNHLTKTEYDEDGNFITATYDEENRKNTFTYDPYGNKSSETDEKGNKKTFAYNEDNQLTKTTMANGTSVSYSYDDNGNTTEKFVTAGGKTQKNIFEYDVDNKLTVFQDALSRKIVHEYDANANRTKTTLPTNTVLEWEYDAANRAIKAKRNGKDAFSYAYDENGNETKVTDHINGITREKAYDEGNRIISMTDRGGSVKWSYQPKSHKLKDTTINHGSYNNTTNYEYNALNQNTKVTDSGKTFYFDYDEFGNVVRYQAGNDAAAQFTYDHTKKLTNLQIGTKDSQRILEESYTYDATSNRTAIERKNGDKTEKTTYAYDSINQLTKETLPNGTSKEYSYDGFGNRTNVKVTEAGKSAVSTAAVFNEGNQLTKFGSESLTYDANGNRTSDEKYKYTWNEADQLTAITKQGESTPFATYKYDDDRRRIEKTVDGKTTRYHYDGDSINPLYETDGSGNVLRQYVYSVDGIRLAMKSQGQTVYYHYNPRGDVIAMTDENGQVVASYEYDAWGNVLKSDAKGIAAENPFGYAGYMYDKEIGMYYLIARYYNPTHGVFLSVDPDPGDEDDPLTQNGYTYANNNPVMMVDSDGRYPKFKSYVTKYVRKVDRQLTQWSKYSFVRKEVYRSALKGASYGAFYGALAGSGWSYFSKHIRVGRGFGGLGPNKTSPRVGAAGGAVIGYHLGSTRGAIGAYGKHLVGKTYVWGKKKYKNWRKKRK